MITPFIAAQYLLALKTRVLSRATKVISLASLSLFLSSGAVFAYEQSAEAENAEHCEQLRQFTFSWSIHDKCGMKPRGGSSKGVKNIIDTTPHSGWLAIQEEGLSQFEKDRRAILAMAGPYRVSFDFLEIAGYVPGFKPSQPYQSWGTEYVYVAEDRGDFISLQHIMVMYFQQEDGSKSAPMVMKHWRQDWQYQKRANFVYAGHDRWKSKRLSRKAVKGTWSQSVYQVDDSPRYEAYGKWLHKPNFSSWKSGLTWRPLPRREGSVRSDYQVLEGTNRHTILPSGWVQEEENLKLVLDANGKPDASTPYLSKELGVARYERIIEHDFTPGDEYWKKSGVFWRDVRAVWAELIDDNRELVIHKKAGEKLMFMPFFMRAQAVADGEEYDSEQGKKQIRAMLAPFIEMN